MRSFPHRQCLQRRHAGRIQGRGAGTYPSTHGRTHLRTPGSARPRRGARRRTSSDSIAGRNARRNADCQSAKTRPRRVRIGRDKKMRASHKPILVFLLRKCTRGCAGPGEVNEPSALWLLLLPRSPPNTASLPADRSPWRRRTGLAPPRPRHTTVCLPPQTHARLEVGQSKSRYRPRAGLERAGLGRPRHLTAGGSGGVSCAACGSTESPW